MRWEVIEAYQRRWKQATEHTPTWASGIRSPRLLNFPELLSNVDEFKEPDSATSIFTAGIWASRRPAVVSSLPRSPHAESPPNKNYSVRGGGGRVYIAISCEWLSMITGQKIETKWIIRT